MTRVAPFLSKVGVIGDVHGQNQRLAEALSVLKNRNCTSFLCTGDIADGAGSVDDCCRLLAENRVATVRGNHDRWVFEGKMRRLPGATQLSHLNESSRTFLATLPPVRYFESAFGPIMLCHSLGDDDMWRPPSANPEIEITDLERTRLETISILLHGHTHTWGLVRVRRIRTLLLNVGSLVDLEPTVTILDLDAGIAERAVIANGAILHTMNLRST